MTDPHTHDWFWTTHGFVCITCNTPRLTPIEETKDTK